MVSGWVARGFKKGCGRGWRTRRDGAPVCAQSTVPCAFGGGLQCGVKAVPRATVVRDGQRVISERCAEMSQRLAEADDDDDAVVGVIVSTS